MAKKKQVAAKVKDFKAPKMQKALDKVRKEHPTRHKGELPKVKSSKMQAALKDLRKANRGLQDITKKLKAFRIAGKAAGIPPMTLKELEKKAGAPRTRSDVIKSKKKGGQGRKF
jgi:hypothetical protein